MPSRFPHLRRTALQTAALALLASPAAWAQQAGPAPATTNASAVRAYDIPAGPLSPALSRFAGQAGVTLSTDPALTEGLRTGGLRGSHGVQEGFAQLLEGTGLVVGVAGEKTYVLRRLPAVAQSASGGTLAAITVTANTERADLPRPYAGRQVARGGRLGLLGNKDVMDTPFNQTSYTSEFIENQSASTVGDMLDNEPSLRHVAASGGGYDGYFTIRGFNVYSSDISFNGLYGLVPWYSGVPTEFVERVEVLKGASALLSGMSPNGALGGAINLVPKRATDQPITRGTVGLDSDALWTTQADIGRRFGPNGEWGLRINGSYRNGDTYIDGQSRRKLLGSLALDYRGDRLRLALDAYSFQEHNRGGDLSGITQNGRTSVIKAPAGSTNIAPGLNWDGETNAVMLSGEYDISKAVTAFAKIGTRHYEHDGFASNAARDVQDNGNASILVGNAPLRRDDVSGEVGLRSEFRTGALDHAITLSTSRQEADIKQASNFVSYPTNIYAPLPITAWPAAPATVPKTSDITLQGIALADTLSILEKRVQLTLGIRRQSVEAHNYNASGGITSSYDQSAWTPMAGLVVKPVEHLSLYANYIEGLSQGTIVATGYNNSGDVFSPYKTKQVEIGAKLETGTITNTVSLFQMRRPSTLTDNSSSPLPTLRLDGEQRNQGVEWNIFGQALPNVRLLGGATYLQGRLTKTQGGANDGNDAPGAAYWGFNIGGEWDPHWVSGLTLTGRLIYTSAQYVDNANTLKLPDWARLDIGARYSTEIAEKAVVFRATIRNLFNRNYYQGIQFENNAILGAPRTFQISASVDF